MQFPPPPIPPSYGACSGVEAFTAGRPPEPAWFVQVNAFVLYVFVGLNVLAAGAWFALRDTERLSMRNGVIVFLTNTGVMLDFVVVAGKRAWVGEDGRPTMPCVVVVLLYLANISLVVAGQVVRASYRLTRTRYTKAIKTFAGREHTGSTSSASASVSARMRSMTIWMRVVTRVSLGFDRSTSSAQVDASSAAAATAAAASDDAATIRALVESSGTAGLAFVFALFALPAGLYAAILFSASPVYQGGCVGCEVFWDLLLVMLIHGSVVSWFVIRVHRLASRAGHDTSGEMRELWWTFTLCPPWQTVGFLLLIFDPASLNYRNVVAWEWCVLVGMLGIWFMGTPLQIWYAFLERRNSVAPGKDEAYVDAATALLNAQVRDAYEAWAEQHFVLESFRFMVDVQQWRDTFFDRAPEFRRRRALALWNLYLAPGAVMEVNVSGPGKAKVWLALNDQNAEVKMDLFDEVLRANNNEVIEYGTWKRFCAATRLKSNPEASVRGLVMRGANSAMVVGDVG